MNEDIEESTWHELAHVRGMALEYALSMLQRGILNTENYMQEAGRYWHFLKDGSIMDPTMEVPDDLSGWVGMGDVGLDLDDIPIGAEPAEEEF